MKTSFRLALLIGLLFAPRAAFAVGELTGRIVGVISEAKTKKPLGGADITVSGPTLIGGPRTVSADDDGRYEVVELPPGTYDVEAGYPGTKPARRRVVVRQGQTTPLD